jgi:hypothetical protein
MAFAVRLWRQWCSGAERDRLESPSTTVIASPIVLLLFLSPDSVHLQYTPNDGWDDPPAPG